MEGARCSVTYGDGAEDYRDLSRSKISMGFENSIIQEIQNQS